MTTGSSPAKDNAGLRKRVLIIDDSQIALLLASDALEKAGYDIRTVLYPADTRVPLMETVNQFQPDLVLTDVDMPLLRGDEFVRILRGNPRFSSMKVFYHSSQRPEELAHHVRSSSADGYIQKSNDLDRLVGRVREILG